MLLINSDKNYREFRQLLNCNEKQLLAKMFLPVEAGKYRCINVEMTKKMQ